MTIKIFLKLLFSRKVNIEIEQINITFDINSLIKKITIKIFLNLLLR